MQQTMRQVTVVAMAWAVALVATPSWAAGDSGKPATTATTQNTTAAAAKVQRCAELKKKIAEFQAAPKGTKPPGSETIKQDIAWYQENCK